MAKIGKITIYVEESRSGHVLHVRTTGRKGTLSLNTVSLDPTYDYVNPGTTAPLYWKATLNEVVALLV